jgi:hypothetical protein
MNKVVITTHLLDPTLKMMMDEERKGQTHLNLRLREDSTDKAIEMKKKESIDSDPLIDAILEKMNE